MILDQFNVFTDNAAVTATGNSSVVNMMPFLGKGEEARVAVIVTAPYSNGADLSVAVQESDTATGTFDTLQTQTFNGVTKAGAVLFFDLPKNLKKKFVRLAYTVTGSPTAGSLFAGVTRDVLEGYESGLYINKGKAQ